MRLLEDSLAEEMLAGRVKNGTTAMVDVNDDGVVNIISEQTRELLPQAVE